LKNKKIIATLGPSSLKSNVIKKMDLYGVDIFRINLSHTDIEHFESIIKKVQSWTSKPVCPDTEGAQLRTGVIKGKKSTIKIENHNIIEFVGSSDYSGGNKIPLSVKSPDKILQIGNVLKIDFNDVMVQVVEINKNRVFCRVISGGIIGTNKAIHIDENLLLPNFTEKDKQAFKISNKLGLNTVFLSFCSNANDVIELRKFFNYEIKIIAKIESTMGLLNLEEICTVSDGILIDRGDLSRAVPIEKVAFAQKFILNIAKISSTPVYVATNLMESMLEKSKPTAAEISDIITTLENGSAGLVLAAETAIGKYPIDCVRIMLTIINEFDKFINRSVYTKTESKITEYLLSLPSDRIIIPHGGALVQQHINNKNITDLKKLFCLKVNEKVASDVIQIAEGVYSPIKSFMNINELQSVLDKNKLSDGNIWTLPILFQIKEKNVNSLPSEGLIALKRELTGAIFALLEVHTIQKLNNPLNIAKQWFGTDDINHPGVTHFLNDGDYILSGKPYLIAEKKHENISSFELTPHQTRSIFDNNSWHNIIGFHTRNVIHSGHEYIQKKALEITNADAIFISPVTGVKKKNDFTADLIHNCYEKFIQNGGYKPYSALLSSFNTYSRYSGPREAVFTAICRKNFGCNYFIVGRDHTGVNNYYSSDASQKIFDSLNVGIKILAFDQIKYCKKRDKLTSDFKDKKYNSSHVDISGTIIRDYIHRRKKIPEYLMNQDVYKVIKDMYEKDPGLVFTK